MIKIEYCYSGGDLVRALREASIFVGKISADRVEGFFPLYNDDSGWTVCIVYHSDEK